ncbi:MAG: hypothetical protein CMB55_02680 [Euryarchaeota archaeon]|nr:hypothetical protein [Euryarchaeota archaeon]|tara:strand:- start:5 stop:274 length:270 start_codon:yes stop_codon:yes gene_type:complete
MEPEHDTSEERDHDSVKSWMVEYTVEVGEETNRHLSMINADDISDVHQKLLGELRKMYQTNERVDVTVHRIEPVSTNTDALYFEGIYAP